MTGKRVNKRKLQAAIPGSGGIIAQIANKTGYQWHTVKAHIDDLIALLWRLKYAPAKPLDADNLPEAASNEVTA